MNIIVTVQLFSVQIRPFCGVEQSLKTQFFITYSNLRLHLLETTFFCP